MTLTSTYYLPEKAGSHDIKFGFEWLDDQSKFANNGSSGPIFYRDLNGAVDLVRLTDLGTFGDFGTGWTGADDRNKRAAIFIQDRWSLNDRFSLTLGLRYDRQAPYYEDSIRNPVLSSEFAPTTVPGTTLLTSNKIVPRIGVSYDPGGDGRSVIKGFYGRYYFNFADRFSNVNPGGTNTRDYRFNDLNGNRLYDGPQERGALVASAGGTSTTLDPDLKTPYADELSLSFERQFWGQSSARMAYVRKMTRDEFATYNVLREGQFTVPRSTPVVISDFVNGTTGTSTLTLFDIPDALRGQVRNVVANIPESVGGGDYNYDTVQFAFNKRFSRGLFIQSSFDYQWRDELRTTQGHRPEHQPAQLRPDFGIGVFPERVPRGVESAGEHQLAGAAARPLRVPAGSRLRHQPALAERLAVRPPPPRRAAQRRHADVLRGEHREQPVGPQHPARLPRRQGVHLRRPLPVHR